MWLETNDSDLAAIADALNAAPRQCVRALERAIDRVVASVRKRYSPKIAELAGISTAAFNAHRTIIIRARAGAGTEASIKAKWWAGFNEISLAHLQNRQTPRGVIAKGKGKEFQLFHAFMVNKRGGNVFISPKFHGELPHGIAFSEKQFWKVGSTAPASERKPATSAPDAAKKTAAPADKKPRAKEPPAAKRERMKRLRQIKGGAARLAYRWASDAKPENVMLLAEAYAAERLPIEFAHELKFEMSRA
jgi:hypothetical protein